MSAWNTVIEFFRPRIQTLLFFAALIIFLLMGLTTGESFINCSHSKAPFGWCHPYVLGKYHYYYDTLSDFSLYVERRLFWSLPILYLLAAFLTYIWINLSRTGKVLFMVGLLMIFVVILAPFYAEQSTREKRVKQWDVNLILCESSRMFFCQKRPYGRWYPEKSYVTNQSCRQLLNLYDIDQLLFYDCSSGYWYPKSEQKSLRRSIYDFLRTACFDFSES